jgi:hypothetical protein
MGITMLRLFKIDKGYNKAKHPAYKVILAELPSSTQSKLSELEHKIGRHCIQQNMTRILGDKLKLASKLEKKYGEPEWNKVFSHIIDFMYEHIDLVPGRKAEFEINSGKDCKERFILTTPAHYEIAQSGRDILEEYAAAMIQAYDLNVKK